MDCRIAHAGGAATMSAHAIAEPAGAGAGAVRRIALCIDDFGLHDGVNAALFELAALGRVNAVGCMVGGPAWRAGAKRLVGLKRDAIDVGLHLDLTEWPLNPRIRRPLSRWIAGAFTRTADRTSIAAEIRDQLDAFEQALGRPPDYVDGHQHVHQFPLVREALLDALGARRSTLARPWLRSTRRPQPAGGAPRSATFKPWLIEALGAHALERQAIRHGHAMNRRLLGVHDFKTDAAGYRSLLAGWLESARDGDLLMCHPAAPSCDAAGDPLLESRLGEHEALTGDGFASLLAASNVELAPISRIRAIRPPAP